MDDIINTLLSVQINCQQWHVKYNDLVDTNNRLLKDINALNDLQDRYNELENRYNESLKRIDNLEEEQKAFLKVSHVIALEKENNRLKQELEKSKKTIPAFCEKKIKGIVYLIDDNMNIYSKELDGNAGACIGHLEKVGDKTKAVWN